MPLDALPWSLYGTMMQQIPGLPDALAAAQEQAQAGTALSADYEKRQAAAQQAFQQLQAASLQPPPAAPVSSPTQFFGDVASIISRNPVFGQRAAQGEAQKRAEMLQLRADNLQALRDNYNKMAQAAGDLNPALQLKYLEKVKAQDAALEKINEQMKLGQIPAATKYTQEQENLRALFKAQGGADENAAPMLSPVATDLAATLYAKTGQLPPMGMGKVGAGVRAKIINRAGQLYPAGDIATNIGDFKSLQASETLLRRTYNSAKAFESTALKNAQVLMDAMAKIPDINSPVLNRPIRAIALKGLGSKELAAYNTARQTVIPEFARILSSPTMVGQLTNEQRNEISKIAGGDYSLKQMQAAINVLRQDASNRTSSYASQIEEIRNQLKGIGQPTNAPQPLSDAEAEAEYKRIIGGHK